MFTDLLTARSPIATFGRLAAISFCLLQSSPTLSAVSLTGYQAELAPNANNIFNRFGEDGSQGTTPLPDDSAGRCQWKLTAAQFLKLPDSAKLDLVVDCPIRIHITGSIDAIDSRHFGDLVQFFERLDPRALLAHSKRGETSIVRPDIRLNSQGGSLFAAIAMGKAIRASDWLRCCSIGTMVIGEDRCYSACVVILAASFRRNVGGTVGIHRPFFSGDEYLAWGYRDYKQAYDGLFAELTKLFESWNVSATLVHDMFAVPSNELRTLTSRQIDRYGLDKEDAVLHEQSIAKTRAVCGAEAAVASGKNEFWWVSPESQMCLEKINASQDVKPVNAPH